MVVIVLSPGDGSYLAALCMLDFAMPVTDHDIRQGRTKC